MDRCCFNCKWHNNTTCNCKEFKQNISIENINNGITYIEDGILSETIRENFCFNELSNMIVDKLKNEDYLKKNKNIYKFNIEALENDIVEMIDDALSKSIMNYFDSDCNKNKIKIANNSNFNCWYWE